MKATELLEKVRENLKDYPIGIAYTGDKVNAEMLKDKIVELIGEDLNIWLQPMSPVNGVHFGFGSVAVTFHVTKKRY